MRGATTSRPRAIRALIAALVLAFLGRHVSAQELQSPALQVYNYGPEVWIPELGENRDRPPSNDELWRTWWTSRVTALEIYASEYVWTRIELPDSLRAGEYITFPGNGEVDMLFADDRQLPIDGLRRFGNFWSFSTDRVVGAGRLYARIQDPSRVSGRLLVVGPYELHPPVLREFIARTFRNATVNSVEWVLHSTYEIPTSGWSEQQPDPTNLKGATVATVRFAVQGYEEESVALWIKYIADIERTRVIKSGRVLFDSSGGATTPESRNAVGDLAIQLNDSTAHLTVSLFFGSPESLAGAFEDLMFPMRWVAIAPTASLFRAFSESRQQGIVASGLVYTRNIVLSIAALLGLVVGITRRGPGFRSFLIFSVVCVLVMLAINADYLWEPLRLLLNPLPGPPKLVPTLAAFLLPYAIVLLVRISVAGEYSKTINGLTWTTLAAGVIAFGIYVTFLMRGDYHIAEQLAPTSAVAYVVGAFCAILVSRQSAERGIVRSFTAMAIATLATAIWEITNPTWSADPIIEAISLVLAFVAVGALLGVPLAVHAGVEQRVREANAVFRRFVPEEFLNYLGIEDISEIEVGRQIETDLTLLFCDIRSFTSISEQLEPPAIMKLINTYLATVSPIIRAHGGFVDKYMGDGVMAVFPESVPGACRAATDIVDAMGGVTSDFELRVGVGLHRGRAMLGTIGERGRIDTTVLSDTVNVASRLQSLSADLDSPVLVSAAVRDAAASSTDLRFEFINSIKLKGREEPVQTYRLTRMAVSCARSAT